MKKKKRLVDSLCQESLDRLSGQRTMKYTELLALKRVADIITASLCGVA